MAETTRNIEQAVINLGKECVVQLEGTVHWWTSLPLGG